MNKYSACTCNQKYLNESNEFKTHGHVTVHLMLQLTCSSVTRPWSDLSFNFSFVDLIKKID